MILTTSRLLLRDAVEQDSPMLREYHSDPRYLEHYFEAPDTDSIVSCAIHWARECPRENYQLVVELKVSRKIIGCIGLRQKGCATGAAEIGVELSPDYWGVGYASEAVRELMHFASSSLAITTLLAATSPSNTRAGNLLKSCGFVQKGTRMNQCLFQARVNAA